ncbi:prevent-host-death protein [Vibrio parahaemolyticus]|nr:prevent-host-death protein [Vibrio parahaemolyticus]TOJ25308.1 prevent-host-death protein [Vibrio parahaemolyticus]
MTMETDQKHQENRALLELVAISHNDVANGRTMTSKALKSRLTARKKN